MSTKRTYQPSQLKRSRKHGFRARLRQIGQKMLRNRRAKGRTELSSQRYKK